MKYLRKQIVLGYSSVWTMTMVTSPCRMDGG